MKKLVSDKGLEENFVIESAATSTEEIWNGIGSPFYMPARAELKKHGIPFSERRATLLVRSDYQKYDLFVGMDNANIRNMNRIFAADPECKIKKLMDFTGENKDVCDPWYSRNFEQAYNDIHDGCVSLLEYIIDEI